MKYHLVQCLAVLLLYISTAYSVNITGKYDDETSKTVFIVIKQNLMLNCSSSEEVDMKWERNGQDITNISDVNKRVNIKKEPSKNVYTLTVLKPTDADIGNYSCVAYKNQMRDTLVEFKVVSQVHVKVPTNINVMEGDKLKIECQTRGKPKVYWTYAEEGAPDDNRTRIEMTDRISFKADEETKIENTILEITNVQMSDRGNYSCWGESQSGTRVARASCSIRIKSRYAALWPFLGICAEVFILCLIIFIYEKKRNKTELEESDTDQSPDQKNTPDHGKESNLRHRQ